MASAFKSSKEALIAHVISVRKLLQPKQLRFAHGRAGSFERLWLDPWTFTPHIIRPEQAQAIEDSRNSPFLETENERLQKSRIDLCAYGEEAYPKLLMQIHSPPSVLYYRGYIRLQAFPLAVIGSRKVSEYGSEAVEAIISGLSGFPISIISGMALGADAAAHHSALRHGLHTVGILGSGIDDASIYPRSHSSLAQRIIEAGGGILSEYPPGTPAHPGFFPMRNRIIAGISRAVLVAEAAAKSGTLITAREALEGGRDVWSIPGSIFSALSSGTNQLISNGAYVAQSSEKFLEAYPELSAAKTGLAHEMLQKIIQEEQSLI